MKQLTLARQMRAVGDRPVVSDAMADALLASGEALSAEPWGAPEVSPPQAQKPRRPIVRPRRPSGSADKRIAR